MATSAPASWTIVPERSFVRVTTSGVLTLADLQAFGLEALACGRRHGLRKYLIDHRLAVTDLNILDVLELPAWYESMGVGPDLMIASLLAKDALRREDFDFFHARTSSRGEHGYRLFGELDEALHWLEQTA
ncbi:hypothetical protein [Arenimonas sp.]|uniref:hypothetical protein n=1 Tax=Arenimonas sp. TaxID=1872635 RepID=UPI0039E43280